GQGLVAGLALLARRGRPLEGVIVATASPRTTLLPRLLFFQQSDQPRWAGKGPVAVMLEGALQPRGARQAGAWRGCVHRGSRDRTPGAPFDAHACDGAACTWSLEVHGQQLLQPTERSAAADAAADEQRVAGPAGGDVQHPERLVTLAFAALLLGLLIGARGAQGDPAAGGVDEDVLWPVAVVGAGVEDGDHGVLQALGGVHGREAHAGSALGHRCGLGTSRQVVESLQQELEVARWSLRELEQHRVDVVAGPVVQLVDVARACDQRRARGGLERLDGRRPGHARQLRDGGGDVGAAGRELRQWVAGGDDRLEIYESEVGVRATQERREAGPERLHAHLQGVPDVPD